MRLLDLRFLELDVLARDRVVLLLDQLVGHGARILLGDVIEAGIRGGNELNLDGDRFGHVQNLKCIDVRSRPNRPAFAGQPSLDRPKVKVLEAKTGPDSGKFCPETGVFSNLPNVDTDNNLFPGAPPGR